MHGLSTRGTGGGPPDTTMDQHNSQKILKEVDGLSIFIGRITRVACTDRSTTDRRCADRPNHPSQLRSHRSRQIGWHVCM